MEAREIELLTKELNQCKHELESARSESKKLLQINTEQAEAVRTAQNQCSDLELKLSVELALRLEVENTNSAMVQKLSLLEEKIAASTIQENGESASRVQAMEEELASVRGMLSEKQSEVDSIRLEMESALSEVQALENAATKAKEDELSAARKRAEQIENESKLTGVKGKSAFFNRQILESTDDSKAKAQKIKEEAARRRAIKEARRKQSTLGASLLPARRSSKSTDQDDEGTSSADNESIPHPSRMRTVSAGDISPRGRANSSASMGGDLGERMSMGEDDSAGGARLSEQYMLDNSGLLSPTPQDLMECLQARDSALAEKSAEIESLKDLVVTLRRGAEEGQAKSGEGQNDESSLSKLEECEEALRQSEAAHKVTKEQLESQQKLLREESVRLGECEEALRQSEAAHKVTKEQLESQQKLLREESVRLGECEEALRALKEVHNASKESSDSSVVAGSRAEQDKADLGDSSPSQKSQNILGGGGNRESLTSSSSPMSRLRLKSVGGEDATGMLERVVQERDAVVAESRRLTFRLEDQEVMWRVRLEAVEEDLTAYKNKLTGKQLALEIVMKEREDAVAEVQALKQVIAQMFDSMSDPMSPSPAQKSSIADELEEASRKKKDDSKSPVAANKEEEVAMWLSRIDDVERQLEQATRRRTMKEQEVGSIVQDLARENDPVAGLEKKVAQRRMSQQLEASFQRDHVTSKSEQVTHTMGDSFITPIKHDEAGQVTSVASAWNASSGQSEISSETTENVDAASSNVSGPDRWAPRVNKPQRRLSVEESQAKLSELEGRISNLTRRPSLMFDSSAMNIEAQSMVYEAMVMDYAEEDEVVKYRIVVRALGGIEWTLFRRYSEFRVLHDHIKAMTSLSIDAKFPKKNRDSWINPLETGKLSTRQKQLKAWLMEVVRFSNESVRAMGVSVRDIKVLKNLVSLFLESPEHITPSAMG